MFIYPIFIKQLPYSEEFLHGLFIGKQNIYIIRIDMKKMTKITWSGRKLGKVRATMHFILYCGYRK